MWLISPQKRSTFVWMSAFQNKLLSVFFFEIVPFQIWFLLKEVILEQNNSIPPERRHVNWSPTSFPSHPLPPNRGCIRVCVGFVADRCDSRKLIKIRRNGFDFAMCVYDLITICHQSSGCCSCGGRNEQNQLFERAAFAGHVPTLKFRSSNDIPRQTNPTVPPRSY